jgi:alpha-1,2-mannosyltransferase
LLDGWYYCKPMLCAACNIVMYNMLGGEGRGPELYGVEAWDYFFRNLLLQWNVLFVLAVIVLPLMVLYGGWTVRLTSHGRNAPGPSSSPPSPQSDDIAHARDMLRIGWYSSGFFLWFAFWARIPHKEERFMVPAYPFLFLAAVGTLVSMWPPQTSKRTLDVLRRFVVVAVVVTFGALSFGRCIAMSEYYGQSQAMWEDASIRNAISRVSFTQDAANHHDVVVCVGKEWYRFPSHFFLPRRLAAGGRAVTYRFLQTESFRGALPKPFQPFMGSCVARHDMNDLNRPNEGQHTDAAACDFVWDSGLDERSADGSQDGYHLDNFASTDAKEASGTVRGEYALLDVGVTPTLCRVLRFPFLSYYQHCPRWHRLQLLERRNIQG